MATRRRVPTMFKQGGAEVVSKEDQDRQAAAGEPNPGLVAPEDNPLDWENMNAPRGADLGEGYKRIVERTVQVSDPAAEYTALEAALHLDSDEMRPGDLQRAVNGGERNARKAHRLWMAARLEEQRWMLENASVFAAMRAEATRALQREKQDGIRTKQITDADIEAQIALIHPDQHQAQEMKRARVHAMVKSLEHLCEMWNRRIGSLQALLGKQR